MTKCEAAKAGIVCALIRIKTHEKKHYNDFVQDSLQEWLK